MSSPLSTKGQLRAAEHVGHVDSRYTPLTMRCARGLRHMAALAVVVALTLLFLSSCGSDGPELEIFNDTFSEMIVTAVTGDEQAQIHVELGEIETLRIGGVPTTIVGTEGAVPLVGDITLCKEFTKDELEDLDYRIELSTLGMDCDEIPDVKYGGEGGDS